MRVIHELIGVLQRFAPATGILAYHGVVVLDEVPIPSMHVRPERLHDQLSHLGRHSTFLPLHELVDRHEAGRPLRGCVAVTFDDAYEGVLTLAAPVLRDLGVPATIFVAATPSAERATFWWDRVDAARRRGGAAWAALADRLGLGSLTSREESMATLRDRVLVGRAGRLSPDYAALAPDAGLRALDFDELRSLATDDRVDFGCHTVSHPALPFLPAQEQEREMRESYERLRAELPRVRPIVAYPFGLYDVDTMEAARRAGMRAGVSMEGRALSSLDDAFALPRMGVGQAHRQESLLVRLNPALRRIFILRAGGPHPRLPAA